MDKKIDFASIWNTLSKIDCSGHTEKKKTGKTELTYLSWTWAWAELMKVYPDATYTIREWDGRPWLDDPVAGVMVMTEVEIGGNVRKMWLAAMDGANNALKREPYTYTVKGFNGPIEKHVDAVDMCAINKAIMRCLVKNLAMFGLGLNIYAGEDLPVGVEDDGTARGAEQDKPAEEKKPAAPSVAPQKPIRTTASTVDPAAAPKKPASGKASLFKQAWEKFLSLKSSEALNDNGKKKFFVVTLKKVVGNDDPHTLTPEEWGRVIAHFDGIAKEG